MTGRVESLLLIHGAGSSGRFMREAFASVGAPQVHALEDRTGDIAEIISALEAVVDGLPRPRVVVGVSLGAHAAARWAGVAGVGRVDALGLVMPAWTGPPGTVAALSRATAARIRRESVPEALAEITGAAPGGWALRQLQTDWPRYGSRLAPALEAAGRSDGPTLQHLSQITIPCGVVAIQGDPLHPESVARDWVAALPNGHLVTLDQAAPAADLCIIGAASAVAWHRAGGPGASVAVEPPVSERPPVSESR